MMLASQRALFDMPRDICYLNSASYSPLPLRTQEAGRAAVGRKGGPWTLDPAFANRTARARPQRRGPADQCRSRRRRADSLDQLRGRDGGKVLTIARGMRVLVLENDHSSPMLEWQTRADAQGFTVETVRQPDRRRLDLGGARGHRTSGRAAVSLASISSVHWSDGGLIDIEKVGAALRQRGRAFLIDATHSIGVLTMDVTSSIRTS